MLAPNPDWYAPVKKKPPLYDAAAVAASLAANPYASAGGYEGPNQWADPISAGTNALPHTIGVGGYNPDYKSLISGDPNMIAGEADLDMYGSQIAKARQAAIRQAVIRSGFKPAGVMGDLDEATLSAADQNQFSTAAELARDKGRRSTDLQASLAARGILASGALAGGSQRIQENYERGTTQGLNSLLDAISGVESDTAAKQFSLVQQRQQLREAAAQRIANDPRYQPLAATDAVLDPGSGLYVTPDGRWYTADGQRANAPVQTSAPAAAAAAAPTPAATSNQEWLAHQAAIAAQGYHTAGF